MKVNFNLLIERIVCERTFCRCVFEIVVSGQRLSVVVNFLHIKMISVLINLLVEFVLMWLPISGRNFPDLCVWRLDLVSLSVTERLPECGENVAFGIEGRSFQYIVFLVVVQMRSTIEAFLIVKWSAGMSKRVVLLTRVNEVSVEGESVKNK